MRLKNRLSAVRKRVALLLLLTCGTALGAGSLECGTTKLCFPDGVAEYGSWVFTSDAKLVARCEGYRVLVVYANRTDMLFLDESARQRSGAIYAGDQGMSFVEFNHYHAARDIETVTCEILGPDKLQISGTASSHHDDSQFRFRIVVDTAKHSYTYEDVQRK